MVRRVSDGGSVEVGESKSKPRTQRISIEGLKQQSSSPQDYQQKLTEAMINNAYADIEREEKKSIREIETESERVEREAEDEELSKILIERQALMISAWKDVEVRLQAPFKKDDKVEDECADDSGEATDSAQTLTKQNKTNTSHIKVRDILIKS